MFKAAKIKKMFEEDDPKLVSYLDSKKVNLKEAFKDDEDLIEKSIRYHKNTIAETAILYNTNINRLNKNNQNYAMIAILYDNYEMFKKLLDYEIKCDVVDVNRENVLFYAIKSDNPDYFDDLMECGVDYKGYNNKGENTAIFAYLNKRKKIADFLIRNGVFINHIDKDGNTLLHHAVKNHDIEFSIKLLEYGADLFVPNYNGESALTLAENLNIDEPLINRQCDLINDLFISGDEEKINELLTEYADIEQYEVFNIPYLIAVFSIKYNHKTLFDRMLKNTDILNSLDYRGKSLLMYCVEFGQFTMARKIIYLKGNLNLQDKEKKTVLFTVIEQLNNPQNNESIKEEYKLIFNELLERRIDVNCQDCNGNTVLMDAIINKQPTIIDRLIATPFIDLNITNREGKTALLLAYEKGDLNTVHRVISSGKADINLMDVNKNTLLLMSLKEENIELFNALLYYGADLDIKYQDGLTILMIALQLKKNRFVAKIFEYPTFNVNLQDDKGMTALMHAIVSRNVKVVEALLKCGANTQIEDLNGESAIFYAVTQEAFDIAKLIRDFEEQNHR